MKELFRPEAIASRRQSWLGSISLAQPVSVWMLGGLVSISAAGIAALLWFGEYARKTHVTGELVPDRGLIAVVAPVAGNVTAPLVSEGQTLQAGAKLGLIAAARASANDQDLAEMVQQRLQQRLQALHEQADSEGNLLEVRRSGLEMQLRNGREELSLLTAGIRTQESVVGIAKSSLARLRGLAEARFVSEADIGRHEQQYLQEVADLHALQRDAAALGRTLASLKQSLYELDAEHAVGSARAEERVASLEQEGLQTEAISEFQVRAPVAGLVATRLVEPGQPVQAGQVMFALLPAGSQLEAHLLVPSRAVGLIKLGDRVTLRFDAFPYQKFGHHEGRILSISRSALDLAGLPARLAAKGNSEARYRVTVGLSRQFVLAYGVAEPLRPGMLVEADIHGERRRLYEWLFEPLYTLSGAL